MGFPFGGCLQGHGETKLESPEGRNLSISPCGKTLGTVPGQDGCLPQPCVGVVGSLQLRPPCGSRSKISGELATAQQALDKTRVTGEPKARKFEGSHPQSLLFYFSFIPPARRVPRVSGGLRRQAPLEADAS